MKATGIVRRIDHLGRVVIPKEVRRTIGIREGDPLEIYLNDGDRTVCFRKYVPWDSELKTYALACLKNIITDIGIYDMYGECLAKTHNYIRDTIDRDGAYSNTFPIFEDGEKIATIVLFEQDPSNDEKVFCTTIAKIISNLIKSK